jgi:hypothetical protein
MPNIPLQNPDRFKDPLGDHMQAAVAAHEKHLSQYPQVTDVYQGFYLSFTPQDARGKAYLSGTEGIIGSDLILKDFEIGLGFATQEGQCIALLDEQHTEQLRYLLEEGWIIRCALTFSLYSSAEQSFTGEAACFCYSSTLDAGVKDALEKFIKNSIDRMGGASYPELALSQEQFVRVVESKGEWFLTKEQPYPSLSKGMVYYRRRKTMNDRLIAQANKGNKGCIVASWIGTAVILAVIIWFIWTLF